MHAYLVTGGDARTRQDAVSEKLKTWRVSAFDQIILENPGTTITISQVRDFQKRMVLVPYNSPYSVGIIREAEKLTVEAQNALLKTIEEPPPHVVILVVTAYPGVLLPTILSRCHTMNLGRSTQTNEKERVSVLRDVDLLLSSRVGQRLRIVAGIAGTREDAQAWVDAALSILREQMVGGLQGNMPCDGVFAQPSQPVSRLIRALLLARSQLAGNVNPKLVLDHVFLSANA